MRDSLHEAAIPKKCPGSVINDLMLLSIELRCKGLFGQCHTDGVCQTLT